METVRQLSADFPPRELRAVDVRVRLSRAYSGDQLVQFFRGHPLPRWPDNIGGRDGAGDRRRRRGARLRVGGRRWTGEIRAEPRADAAVDAALADVDVRLLHRAFQLIVGQFEVDGRVVVADA